MAESGWVSAVLIFHRSALLSLSGLPPFDYQGDIAVKSRKLAAGLALLGVVTLPGIHRFYLGQSRWGLVYLLLAWKTPISRIASGFEAIWYLFLDDDEFDRTFNDSPSLAGVSTATTDSKATPGLDPAKVEQVVSAVREIENLRKEGLMTETEFEQKRRKLLDQID